MKPGAFDYVRIDTAEEAWQLLAQYGDDARILAGGQTLMAMLNMRLAQPKVLLDVSRTAPLDYVRVQDGKLAIGAAATQRSVEWRASLASDPSTASGWPSESGRPNYRSGSARISRSR